MKYAYSSAGTYNVSLTVTDGLGQTSSTTTQITISAAPTPDEPPMAAIEGPASAAIGGQATFSAAAIILAESSLSFLGLDNGLRVHINGAGIDPKAPFGGYKQSGNGREFGKWGIEEFLETKALLGYNDAA